MKVTWRYGQTTVLSGVGANREYEIREPQRVAAKAKSGKPQRADSAPPLFSDVSNMLHHTHVETPFDDYVRQPLLANKLSQLGPGITWSDVDGNGTDDLIIGSGRGGRLALFENSGGRFTRRAMSEGESRADQTTILVMPDGHGGKELLVGQSSYEAATPQDALALPSVIAMPLSRAPRGRG